MLTAGGGAAAGLQPIAGSNVAVVGAAVDASGSRLVRKQLEWYVPTTARNKLVVVTLPNRTAVLVYDTSQ